MSTDIGNIIGLLLQNQYGKKAPRRPLFAPTPEPPYERALREYTARLLAQGATSVPPTLRQWASSGGIATLNLGNTALTPGEAEGLGQVGKKGQPVPWMQPGQTQLTPEQIMFIAAQGKESVGSTKDIRKEARQFGKLRSMEARSQAMEGRPQTKKREKREQKLSGREQKLAGELAQTPLASTLQGGK